MYWNLVLFFAGTALLALLLIKLTSKGKQEKYGKFLQAVKEGAVKAVPETAGFSYVMAQGAKDAISTVKGYDRIQTGYASLPSFTVCYQGDELYIMAIPCPSVKAMEPDPEFILHITRDMLSQVKFGPMGKIAFYFKDSKEFFAMTVTDYAIPLVMQPEERRKFKPFIREFAARVNA